jgi:hypothetical protein
MGSSGCDLGQRSVVDVVTKYIDGVPKGVAVQQTVTWTPQTRSEIDRSPCNRPAAVAARSAAETVAGQIFSVEYDGIEYGGLPVSGNDYVIGRRNGLITAQPCDQLDDAVPAFPIPSTNRITPCGRDNEKGLLWQKIGKGPGVLVLPLPRVPGTCTGKATARSVVTRWSGRSRTVGRAASLATCRTVCAAPTHDERCGGETTGHADVSQRQRTRSC